MKYIVRYFSFLLALGSCNLDDHADYCMMYEKALKTVIADYHSSWKENESYYGVEESYVFLSVVSGKSSSQDFSSFGRFYKSHQDYENDVINWKIWLENNQTPCTISPIRMRKELDKFQTLRNWDSWESFLTVNPLKE